MSTDLVIQDREWANKYISEHKLRVAHFRNFDSFGEISNYGGLTFVWKHRTRDKLVTISSAVCNDKDNFCRHTGRILATKKFEAGQVIQLPVTNYISAWHMICNVFGDRYDD